MDGSPGAIAHLFDTVDSAEFDEHAADAQGFVSDLIDEFRRLTR